MAAKLDLFVKPATLHAAMDDADVQIVAVDTPDDFADAHIPGAHRLAMADFTAKDGAVGGLIPDDATLADVFSKAGLRNDAHIVAYDRAGDGQAARLLYTLDVMGHAKFSLLDGGLGAWHAAGLPLESGTVRHDATDFQVTRQGQGIADRNWITQHREESDVRILDVRSAAEFAGEDVRSARGGHVPGAVNLDWQQLKNDHGQLRDLAEIRRMLAERDIDPSKEVATYCQTHVRSSYAYLVLKALGYEHVRGYPGAWSDWGNAEDTPVETGA
ncbi:sulfurtransferase [Salinisphaera hydrothermalis]|uniref:Thiosulfate sulfurtransferase n=1 Tax=Salinisphaera hydrothermalis (strain C41B8) TaxID=1304275 RepID=A0A084IJR1_SALHC|nr:sulfurtransferase [Salinisphaera hydrothermalis]KEZ76945.1 thiosulfate sulfurtransferase [Salinisphaera hydrothermalis C41B8]